MERRNDIDWLRIGAVLLLFVFHTAHIFDYQNGDMNWYVKNGQTSIFFNVIMFFISLWHMPLFFLLSGVGTCFALRFRSGGEYSKERVKRLFVPLLFGTLVIVPPQVYVWKLLEGKFSGSFLQFYPHFFNAPRPIGNLEWGHLWFLAYLFTFSMIMRPVFQRIRSDRGRALVSRLAELAGHGNGWGIVLLALPVAFSEALLRPTWPNGNQNLVNDWANFLAYTVWFSYGFLIFSDPRFEQSISRIWKSAGWIAFAFFFGFLFLLKNLGDPKGYTAYSIGFNFLSGFDTWLWLIWFLGLGRALLTAGGRMLRYAAEAALPVYVLHQTVIVLIGYYAIRLSAGPYLKFCIISVTSLIATIIIYELLVRHFNPVRVLFGMKRKKPRLARA